MKMSSQKGKNSCNSTQQFDDKKIKAQWNERTTKIFCEVCVEEIDAGNRPNTHFSKSGWKNVIAKFNSRTKANYDYKQLKNKWDGLRKEWALWMKLMGKETGLGWDYEKSTIDASDDWWEKRIEAYPDCRKFRERGIENRYEMERMFSTVVATSETAWTPASGVLPNEHGKAPAVEVEGSGDLDEIGEYSYGMAGFTSQNSKRKNAADMHKGKGTATKKGKVGNASHMMKALDRICEAVESYNSPSIPTVISKYNGPPGCSIADCMAILKSLPEMDASNKLFMVGTNMFLKQNYREMFVALGDPELQVAWLQNQFERESKK